MSSEWVGNPNLWRTSNFGLQVLRGQPVAENDYAFTDADRVLIDKLLAQIFVHQHTNTSKLTNPLCEATPSETVTLTLQSGGSIPSGSTVCYRVSFYDDTGETEASPEQTIAMPAPIDDPAIPSISTQTTGGTLVSGQYLYAISAIGGGGETYASDPGIVLVGTTTSTNKNTVTFPSAPTGATHWNIYRKKDNGSYYYMTQVTVATPSWADDGSVSPDCDQEGLPEDNTTNSDNKVKIELSGIPSGATGYRIYRSIVSGYYGAYSELVDQADGATPVLVQYDTYQIPDYGVPLEADRTYGTPPKVNLSSEVQDHLPTSHITPLDAILDFAEYMAKNFVFDQGTSFPGSPSDGQVFYRTDQNKLYIFISDAPTPGWKEFAIDINLSSKYIWTSPTFMVIGDLWDSSLATPAIKSFNNSILPKANLTIIEVYARVETAPVADPTPVSAGVRIDILKNGVSIFATDNDKPLIPNGSKEDGSTTIQTTSLTENDRLNMEIETVDDTHTAADLSVFVRCKQFLSG